METRRERYAQSEAMSCGAAALMCALVELGCTHYANQMPGLEVGNSGEKGIYRDINTPLPGTSMPGYSFPPKVAEYAIRSGLRVKCYVPGNRVNTAMSTIFYTIRPDLAALGVVVEDDTMPLLRPGQRALRVVRRAVVGLHWVLIRPDASWMDPDGGKEHTFFLNTLSRVYPDDTGISLVLTKA